ncbi:anthranilate phosphoribosyltransferase [Leucothrix pacifica]|uniref:Anthranilate phosphoribosyltransferase n=1 Tax=Leucothrix pacifica TaxID=1247513 RepID=A0A317C9T6_9GAMM|nr:anthranilate phosphoribosyltransferase [Leucothrix pacifica]PWQ94083.1 anthranilate phosphoribosyltransferase [Leucothrix pacifica]
MNDLNLQLHMRQCIQKVATGPDYSKDLSFEEARDAMRAILTDDIDPVQTAILFIALRMKRETDEENRGILQALIDTSEHATASVDELVDISDPYDGYARGVPASPFLPAVLAALGVNAVSHGLEVVGPKFGATHHRVLKAAGLNVGLSVTEAAAQIERIGWAYVDQQQFAPALNNLMSLRQRMVKRQVLNTVESLLGPVRAKHKTHFMCGYVHKAYPPIYASLARQAGFDTAMFVRGVEGGTIPSLQQQGKLFYYHDLGELAQRDVSPGDVNIEATSRAIPLPDDLPEVQISDTISLPVDGDALAAVSAQLGVAALSGERGMMYDSMVYAGSIVLTHLECFESMNEAANAVRQVLDNGAALDVFQAAQQA